MRIAPLLSPTREVSEQIVRDLMTKAGDDVRDRLALTLQLLTGDGDKLAVAMCAAAQATGTASGLVERMFAAEGTATTAEELADGLWSLLRPAVIAAATGQALDTRALLSGARG